MQRLTRPAETIEHPEDVAAIRAAMRGLGYDASDEDIQWAFEELHLEDAPLARAGTPRNGPFSAIKWAEAVIERLVPAEPAELALQVGDTVRVVDTDSLFFGVEMTIKKAEAKFLAVGTYNRAAWYTAKQLERVPAEPRTEDTTT